MGHKQKRWLRAVSALVAGMAVTLLGVPPVAPQTGPPDAQQTGPESASPDAQQIGPAPASPAPPAAQAGTARRPGQKIVLYAKDVAAGTAIPPRDNRLDDGRQMAQAAAAPPVVTYAGGIPAAAQAAVQAAIDTWMGLVSSSVPMRILVNWTAIPGCPTCLAGAGPDSVYSDIVPASDTRIRPSTWYPPALAEALLGFNVNEPDPNEPDIGIDINSARSNWYFGTDGNPGSGQYDLRSVIMHEMLHGFGFLGTASVSAGQGRWGLTPSGGGTRLPDIWDRFVQDSGGASILSYSSPSVSLANTLQGNNLYFGSTLTNRSLADRPKLYAPNPWNSGSSYSHLDETTYPPGSDNSLATPFLSSQEVEHAAGPLALCMLEALGWVTPMNCTPPPRTTLQGATWFNDGSTSKTGPSGTVVSAFATGVSTGRGYKLVTGLDGGPSFPCMWDVVPVNNSVRFPNSRGFIPMTSGPVNRGPGRWQLCFREEGTGATVSIGQPVTFTVT